MKKLFILFIVLIAVIGYQTVSADDSAEVKLIKIMFTELQKSWNGKDTEAYRSFWLDGAKIITKRGRVFTMNSKGNDQDNKGMLKRMKDEERKYNPQKIEILSPEKAKALVKFNCTECPAAGMTMEYELIKKNGKWLIQQQKAL